MSWKSIKFGCHGYLSKWESMKCSLPQSGRLIFCINLTSRNYIAIYILTTRCCLVLLIVNVSQINWLSCQIFGISKQALYFVRDGKILRPRWKLKAKVYLFFYNTPSRKWFGPTKNLHLGYLWRTKFLVTFEIFHGKKVFQLIVCVILCVTDGRNANTELITLYTKTKYT